MYQISDKNTKSNQIQMYQISVNQYQEISNQEISNQVSVQTNHIQKAKRYIVIVHHSSLLSQVVKPI